MAQSLIHALHKAGYGYVLSIEGIYQFDDPEDKASDIYKTSAIKREDRITSILGKHFKENPDTARQNAYYEVCSTIKPDIVRALQESGKVSRNVGSLITYLDAKHIRKDNYTLAALYESYFFLTLHEGDDIETHIELLNHAATLLHNVVIHPCPSTSRIETRMAMRIAAHGLCVCRCILYYSFHSTTAYWCHPFHPLYYSDRLWAHVSLVS